MAIFTLLSNLRWDLDDEQYVNKEERKMIERIMLHEFIQLEELKAFLETKNALASSSPSNG